MAAASPSTFLRQLRPAALALVVFTAVLGLAYPLAELAIGQVAFPDRVDGSLVTVDGTVVGSRLIGQEFVGEQYFHSRPSAAGYDGAASSGSNLGPTNPELSTAVEERAIAYRELNGLVEGHPVPVDAVTSSASGLDPHISVANARLQAPRVAERRGVPVDEVLAMVQDHIDDRPLGVLGDPGVNVLELNLRLDGLRT